MKKIIPKYSVLYYILSGGKTIWSNITALPSYKKEYRKFTKISSMAEERFPLNWDNRFPCLTDKTIETTFDSHYIYHPAWASRILAQTRPELHIDISSTLHFCTMLSAFMPVKFYDYRPASLTLSNLSSEKADLLNLPFQNDSISSVSCMHTIEHIGLGRYGDPLDYDGDIKAIKELIRVTKNTGDILFVTPVGQPKLMFNGQRIYSYQQVISYFTNCTLMNFSLIPDSGGIINNADPELVKEQKYGCGCFWFRKIYTN